MSPPPPTLLTLLLLLLFSLPLSLRAQNSSASVTTITSSIPVRTTTFTSASRTFTSTSFNLSTITSTIVPTSTSAGSPDPTNSNSSQDQGPKLDTILDPAFGVLGALLILTGLPSAFLGHKNRWSSYFLTGFYSLAIVCLALILKFGVLEAINPPSRALRGLFVLSCGIAGIAGGAGCILFWNQARYLVGGLGGVSFGLWIQCFRNGGLIRPIGLRWILFIACGVVGFALCTIPRIHYHMLLASTAIVGATAFMLGVDCYTLVNLKEFYVYNLGFNRLFPKFAEIPFPVSQTMQIEIGLIAATAIAGAAIQLRVLTLLQLKLRQIKADQKRRDQEIETHAVERFEAVNRDLDLWEKRHGSKRTVPTVPLKSEDGPQTPGGFSEDGTLIGNKRARTQSGLSEFMAPPEEPKDRRQSIGLLPVMNLGGGIQTGLPERFTPEPDLEQGRKSLALTDDPEIKQKEGILAEIEEMRKTIDWLRNSTPPRSEAGGSRHVSTSNRPKSLDGAAAFGLLPPTHRPRVQSMDILSTSRLETDGGSDKARGRTTSTPLRDDDWDSYVKERQLFTPPSGVSAPIAVSDRARANSMLITLPDAVQEAIGQRHRRESLLGLAGPIDAFKAAQAVEQSTEVSEETQPVRKHKRSLSAILPTILPPKKKELQKEPLSETKLDETPKTRTFEELAERHRRKMHDLQRPLTLAEKEQAKVEAAKNRWERSRQIERADVEKRQADQKAAVKGKEKKTNRQSQEPLGGSSSQQQQPLSKASRPLTPDQLSAIPGSSAGRRSSTAKVLEWQRAQQVGSDVERVHAVSPLPGGSRRISSQGQIVSSSGVPFPGGAGSNARPPREAPVSRSMPRAAGSGPWN